MTWGWQDLATFAVVASALGYLARKFVPGLAPRPAVSGCAHCPVKAGGGTSCHDQPVVITLIGPPGTPNGRPPGPADR